MPTRSKTRQAPTTRPDPTPEQGGAEVQIVSVTINRAVEITGVPRSGIYEQISSGKLKVARVGRRTLITMQSIREMITQGVKLREAEVAQRVADYKRRAAKRQAQRAST